MSEPQLTNEAKLAILRFLGGLLTAIVAVITLALSAYIYYFYESVRDNATSAVARAINEQQKDIETALKKTAEQLLTEAERLSKRLEKLNQQADVSREETLRATTAAITEAKLVNQQVTSLETRLASADKTLQAVGSIQTVVDELAKQEEFRELFKEKITEQRVREIETDIIGKIQAFKPEFERKEKEIEFSDSTQWNKIQGSDGAILCSLSYVRQKNTRDSWCRIRYNASSGSWEHRTGGEEKDNDCAAVCLWLEPKRIGGIESR